MKIKPSPLLFALWLALALMFGPALRAADSAEATAPKQETPAAPAKPADEKPAPAVEPAAEEKKAEPVAPVATEEKQTAEADKPAAVTNNDEADKKLRVLGATIEVDPKPRHRRHHSNNERVSFWQDSTLAAGEQADAVVSVMGSSTSAGDVSDAVVSVFGSSLVTGGTVGDAVVSVIGNTRVTAGTVGDTVVSVLGSTYVNGHIKGQVVAVLGNIELGPDAVVDGEIVCVGGEVNRDPKAVVHGNIQHVAVGGRHFSFVGLQAWFSRCLLYGRPLAFGEHLMWAWWIALAYLGFYAFLALVMPGGVTKCVETLEERPGKSILAGLLALLLTPVAYLLLALTLFIAIGFVLIPLFSLGLFFAALVGKVVMLTWLGRRLMKLFGAGSQSPPIFAVLIGGVIVLGLYTVPVLGFIVYKLLGVLGLGVVIYTLLLSIKSNRPAPRPAAPAGTTIPPVMGDPAGSPAMAVIPALPPVISAATLPRAGFWIRLAASFLDFFLIVFAAIFTHAGPGFMLLFAAYCTIMWATKGTTIGGIICGLKVVRLDDRPLDWGIALVRALGGFLSFCVAGLGFIWVAFDDEKQSWHDKIAGTTIVRVPKGTSLV